MRVCELKNKDVINACECRILGTVCDIEFNSCSGHVEALVVPGPGRLFGLFGRDIEYVIPFKCVKCIGPDAVLVEVNLESITRKVNCCN